MRTKKNIAGFILIFAMLLPIVTFNAEAASTPSTNAKANFLLNLTTGEVYYEKNADSVRAPASLTKLMTVLMLYEAMERGAVTKDTLVEISNHTYEIASDPEGSNVPLKCGEKYTVDELLHAAMTVSANGAACALGELLGGTEEYFAQLMTARAHEYGWEMTYYDASGLSDENCVTARSMAMLASTLITKYPDVLNYSSCTSINFRGKTYNATNGLLPGKSQEYAGTDGLKTGTTSLAGKCLIATCQRDGNRLLSVVLGADSTSTRYGDTINMFNYGFSRTITMIESPQSITVNGIVVDMKAYNYEGHNYIMLRDLASSLVGTVNEFAVGWEESSKTITITTGVPETETEAVTALSVPEIIGASQNSDSIVVDGSRISVNGFLANGRHYYSLRELAQIFGLNLDYDAATQTVLISAEQIINVMPVHLTISDEGNSALLQAYESDETLFIKPSDLAMALIETTYHFNVSWSEDAKAYYLETGCNYTPGEEALTDHSTDEFVIAQMTELTLYVDDTEQLLSGIAIEGVDYCSLDDLARMVGFTYSWENDTVYVA